MKKQQILSKSQNEPDNFLIELRVRACSRMISTVKRFELGQKKIDKRPQDTWTSHQQYNCSTVSCERVDLASSTLPHFVVSI